jgi:DNA-binding CsgD family transcriptional regulator
MATAAAGQGEPIDFQGLMLAMIEAEGPRRRFHVLSDAMGAIGINQINYGFFDPAATVTADAEVIYVSTMRTDWLEYYQDRALHLTDPHVVKVRRGNLLPYHWGEAQVASLDDPAMRRAADETREAGLSAAICVPMAGAFDPTRPVAGMTLGSTLSEAELSRLTAGIGSHIVALAHAFHTLSLGALTRERMGIPPLTSRERDCLSYVAQGLRQDSLAWRMGLSRATVEMHLGNARRKLKARTLPEAVARALVYGEIQP